MNVCSRSLVSMICLLLSALLMTDQWFYVVQKLAASLSEKGLNSDTGVAASDEADYGQSIEMFLQYGDSLSVIDQINSHSYPGVLQSDVCSSCTGSRWMSVAAVHASVGLSMILLTVQAVLTMPA